MAERRMFAQTIVDSDAFLDLPLSAQALYFHLGMRADDDGFINNPRKVMRMIGADEEALQALYDKNFIIGFESGVVVIKHWKIHNYIRKDRKQDTLYTEEHEQLIEKDNGAYTVRRSSDNTKVSTVQSVVRHMSVTCQSDDSHMSVTCPADVSIGKDSIGKDSIGKDNVSDTPKRVRFVPPTEAEVIDYCLQACIEIDTEAFIDFYTSKGWKVGSQPMKDWKAAVRNWSRRDKIKTKSTLGAFGNYKQSSTDDEWDEITNMSVREVNR